MATIDIKLSQSALAQQPASGLGTFVDGIERVFYVGASNYVVFSKSAQSGSSLVYTYADGGVETYSGFVKSNAGASSGTATATDYDLKLKNSFDLSYTGKLNLDYTTTAGGISVNTGGKAQVIDDIGYALELPPTDPQYVAQSGNVAVRVKGMLNVAPNEAVSGTIGQFLINAERGLTTVQIDGDFHVSGNLLTDGEGLTHSSVSGTLTGYHLAYADGSHFDVGGVAVTLNAPATLNMGFLSNPDDFGGNDTVNLDLPSNFGDSLVATGAGDDQISIRGGSAKVFVDSGDGNDRITLLDDSHTIMGGKGIDTVVVQAPRADYQLSLGTDINLDTVTNKLGIANFLFGVERIQFSDATIALDINGNGGQAYRLYQAAFARTPDKAGLGFWIGSLDNGATLNSVAQGFVASDEFRAAYGANPSNHDLVTQFYQNILHRAPEQAGLDYWVGILDNKQGSVADVLMQISESAENKAGLVGVIGNGFEYTPYH
jgi:hypothetical protein